MIDIENITDPRLDVFRSLNEPQLKTLYEPHGGVFIAESLKVIGRALQAGYEPVSLLVEDRLLSPDTEALFKKVPLIFKAPYAQLRQITGYELTGGMLCCMRRKALPDAAELCRNAHRIAVLERVTNPTNIGAIFRSAAAMNMDAVLLTKDCCDPLYRRAVRVSMGNVFEVPWTYLDKATDVKAFGFKTAALALRDDTCDIRDRRLKTEDRLAVFLGSEGNGLTNETVTACDYVVKIPMRETVDSLNVAAASAVAFWELGNLNRYERSEYK